MRVRLNPVEALATLPRLEEVSERRSSWRQAIAALGRSVRVAGPPPLDGISTEHIVGAAQTALATGLADDLDWIAPGAAAVALYELTSALPAGAPERREFGRRVFARLYRGDAATFSLVATRMALTSTKPLDAATMRARVGLALDLPIGSPVHADPLAYSLVARRALFQEWVDAPSTGALPARRLSAIILERAAREGLRRTDEGDPQPRELLRSAPVAALHERLLADREPLVWRHAAVARGLSAAVDSRAREKIELALDPALNPGVWRRAAVSLVTLLVHDPRTGLKQCRGLLQSDIARRDPGIAATMIWGLPRVIEAEPDAAEELLDWLSASRRPDVAEATSSLLREVVNPDFGRRAATTMRAALDSSDSTEHQALLTIFEGALASPDDPNADTGIDGSVRRALHAYETRGARFAFEASLETVAASQRVMDGVEALSAHGSLEDPDLVALLMDLDASVLERARLANLLLLGRRPGDTDATVPELELLHDRLGRWLIDREAAAGDQEEWTTAGVVARQRRLRALLHLMDVESAGRPEGEGGPPRMHARVRRAVSVLLNRIAETTDARVHRILCATLARSFDATVREDLADPSDLFLVTAKQLSDGDAVSAIAQGSTSPDVSCALGTYAEFVARGSKGAVESIGAGSFDPAVFSRQFARGEEERVARSFVELSQGLGAGGSYRGEALRQVVLRMGRALEAIAVARGLSDLAGRSGGDLDPLGDLEEAIDAYARLETGAVRRLLDDDPTVIDVVAEVPPLSALIERAVSAGVPPNAKQISMSVGELTAKLPDVIAAAVAQVLVRVDQLPTQAASDDSVAIPLQQPRAVLPDWLLPRRVIGAFYVVRALGSGGGSSVFLARRIEERHDSNAEAFALKVPQYDPSTARSLSEQEFMDLFRAEAGALLSLPQQENLARFVTFDLAARPKPILVMELIKGAALDRAIRNRSLTTDRVFQYLDGILQGLEAMHSVGVGHLDVKPSNIIVRASQRKPVLVDFGLSGRHVRPGCGTLEYTAPEILGVVPEGHELIPMDADVYAFACMAYELLTGDILLDADDETTLITMHLKHDGWPDKLAALAEEPELTELAQILASCLRRDPRNRPGSTDVRELLQSAAARLSNAPWPLAPRRSAANLTA